MSAAYLMGREEAKLREATTGNAIVRDKLFVAERIEEQELAAHEFRHCTFANVSFKGTILKNMRFTDCVFFECYFRKASLESCAFAATRFVDCRFPHVKIRSCHFQYAAFRGCSVPFDEVQHSLPSAPNEREQLALNLAQESEKAGDSMGAHRYRLEAFNAHEEHLWCAVVAKSSWYKEHYPGFERVKAAGDLVRRKTNGWLWGYGESFGRLVLNFAFLMIGVFPGLFWYFSSCFQLRQTGAMPGFSALVGLSCAVMLRTPALSTVDPSRSAGYWLLGTESLVSLVFVGLFGSYLFRAILRR